MLLIWYWFTYTQVTSFTYLFFIDWQFLTSVILCDQKKVHEAKVIMNMILNTLEYDSRH